MICVDEFGPMELRPHAGRSWQRKKKPVRFRATYTRPHGVRHLLSYYDVGKDELHGHFKPRKRSCDFLVFLKAIRRRYRGPIWIVLDNLSAHRTEEIMNWAEANNVRFQFTPTDASWLNRIECEFTSLKKATLTHVDYASFDEMRQAIQDWIYWRNKRKARLLKLKGH